MTYGDTLDALGDPTRRAILERLQVGPRAVGELARDLPVSRPAVSQHLKVLKDAGLVRDEAVGTRRLYQVDPAGLASLRSYLESFWDRALDDFRVAAEHDRKERTMSTETAIEPILRTVTVRCPVERAFELYTEGIARWWPLETHSVAAGGAGTAVKAVIEPRAGGRMYEVMADRTEAPWGVVDVWEPPHRLVIAWKVNPAAAAPTEIEVRFTPERDGTRVEVEHRGWERLGIEKGREARSEYHEGWGFVLGRYAEAANTAT
ncbi:MAG TPA: metalloregulator ArsR/SmtB family transcription factor [Gaiellales bacterium]|nr:metalloregulator ArsR/SmtB family transcription factor [Gaiellales bacterium]